MREKIPSDQKRQEGKSSDSFQIKKHFTEPKLKFIKPKLTKQGYVSSITAGPIFGTPTPGGGF